MLPSGQKRKAFCWEQLRPEGKRFGLCGPLPAKRFVLRKKGGGALQPRKREVPERSAWPERGKRFGRSGPEGWRKHGGGSASPLKGCWEGALQSGKAPVRGKRFVLGKGRFQLEALGQKEGSASFCREAVLTKRFNDFEIVLAPARGSASGWLPERSASFLKGYLGEALPSK